MLTALLVLVSACSAPTPLPTGVALPDPTMAPAPFTTDALREHNVDGRFYAYRVQSPDLPDMRRTMAFSRGSLVGAHITSTVGLWDAADAPADSTEADASWAELQGHAAYPAASTVRSWSAAALPGGDVPCVLYTVDEGEGRVTRACFDLSQPGPPVLLSQSVGDAAVFTMTLHDSRVVVGAP